MMHGKAVTVLAIVLSVGGFALLVHLRHSTRVSAEEHTRRMFRDLEKGLETNSGIKVIHGDWKRPPSDQK